MAFLYNVIAQVAWWLIKLLGKVGPKMRLFVEGRKETFPKLERAISKEDKIIWVHAASLGEFEQGLPVIEKLKSEKPSYKILITFFSPSGYEVKKNTSVADIVVYLPFDTQNNVNRFLDLTKPKLVIFVKYEIWPNYLKGLEARKIPTVLVSALFKKKQVYFRWYGNFMRKSLRTFSHIFVQNEKSKELLLSIGIKNSTVNGDTRLDRVSKILERDNTLTLINSFKKDNLCVVAGSTWPEDETILIDFINKSSKKIKYVLAPHKIAQEKIVSLAKAISKKRVLFSNSDINTVHDYDVLIIDNIGMLTKIYSYADIAYVGGAFSTGLHNTLEPAVFGIPVIIGPNYKGFQEAEDLVAQKGILSVRDTKSFEETVETLLADPNLIQKTGLINASYIAKNKGASVQIMNHIRTLL